MSYSSNKPLWQLTVDEFTQLLTAINNNNHIAIKDNHPAESTKYVYGITGIAELLDCSKSTANRIKKSGKIDPAISQLGRKIVVDAELALKLAKKKHK
ncbi:MAG: hypothetical protein C0459_13735 [Chitinophaga sp.]|jgi:hypothetical protein|nr:hypothetical protein [Chitinophaga sp.]